MRTSGAKSFRIRPLVRATLDAEALSLHTIVHAIQPGSSAMSQQLSSSPPPSVQSLSNVLQAKGFVPSDFVLAEDTAPSMASDVFGDGGGWMRVRCRSTGEERL